MSMQFRIYRSCRVCHRKFTAEWDTVKVCGKCKNKSLTLCSTCGETSKGGMCLNCVSNGVAAIGYYVYGWYNRGEQLPFYIGKGKGLRAWRCNKEAGIEVVIFRDNLTEMTAFAVEEAMIKMARLAGAKLRNSARGTHVSKRI